MKISECFSKVLIKINKKQTMSKHQPEKKLAVQAISIDADKLLDNWEEIELLHEQIASLKLELSEKNQQLQEIEEELRFTNQELRDANHELCEAVHLQYLTLNQAKQLATAFLRCEKPTRECLAELLSAIYGASIEAWELGSTKNHLPSVKNSTVKIVDSHRSSHEQIKLKNQFNELGSRFIAFKASFARFKAEYAHIKKSITRVK